MRLEPSEKQIQQAVVDAWRKLGTPGSLVACVPNANAHGQAGLTAGLFDLIVFSKQLGGRMAWLELKTKRGKLSPAQREFRAGLIELGHPHAVAYGIDEALVALRSWGAIRT